MIKPSCALMKPADWDQAQQQNINQALANLEGFSLSQDDGELKFH